MTMIDGPRPEQAEEARVTTIELFFDLVFVFHPDPAHRAPG
jgi:low temperature requirement protein LtrA